MDNARCVSIPQSLMPALIGVALACIKDGFSVFLSVLAVFGVCMAHLAFNLFDDYFDYKKNEPRVRETLARAGVRARVGKCAYLTSGKATSGQLLTAAVAFSCLALLPGFAILYARGLPILYIAAGAGLMGLFYSAEPLKLSYRGLGELTIGLIFGPLLVMGVFYSSCGALDWSAVLIGAAIGFLVMNVLYIHSVLDDEADRSVNKHTLAGLIPTAEGRLAVCNVFTFAPYAIIAAGMISRILPLPSLLLFLTLPFALSLCRSMTAFSKEPGTPVRWRLWHGPMQKWKEIQAAGLEWFMFRWYLARNLLTVFSLLCILSFLIGDAR